MPTFKVTKTFIFTGEFNIYCAPNLETAETRAESKTFSSLQLSSDTATEQSRGIVTAVIQQEED